MFELVSAYQSCILRLKLNVHFNRGRPNYHVILATKLITLTSLVRFHLLNTRIALHN